MKKKVLLINPPQNTRYPQPPVGLAILAAVLEAVGYEVAIADGNIKVYQGIKDYEPDVVGITAMTSTITEALGVAKKGVKVYYPKARIIIGGAHATVFPEETLKSCPEIDAVVVGEGEHSFKEVIEEGIWGVYKSRAVIDMDSLPFPAYHLLPWRKYRPHPPHGRAMPWLPMVTSRGCVYKCNYCSRAVFGDIFRAQSPKRVVDEIEWLQSKYNVREIGFYDDVFTLDKRRAHGIAEEMLRRGIKVCWTCETRADLVDKALLKHMKQSGCYSISYGMESASQTVLDAIGKGITPERSEEAIRLTKEAGIKAIGYFMIGSPNETPATIRQTIDFSKRLDLDYAQFAVTTPYPGSAFYSMYRNGDKRDEVIPWERFAYAGFGERLSPMFESCSLAKGDIDYWVGEAYREFYLRASYVMKRLAGIRSAGDIMVLAKGLSMLNLFSV